MNNEIQTQTQATTPSTSSASSTPLSQIWSKYSLTHGEDHKKRSHDGKLKHKTEAGAEVEAHRLTKVSNGLEHTHYPCCYCQGWHVGRSWKFMVVYPEIKDFVLHFISTLPEEDRKMTLIGLVPLHAKYQLKPLELPSFFRVERFDSALTIDTRPSLRVDLTPGQALNNVEVELFITTRKVIDLLDIAFNHPLSLQRGQVMLDPDVNLQDFPVWNEACSKLSKEYTPFIETYMKVR